MRKFITRPEIDLYEGVLIKKNTKLTYKSDEVEQEIKDLKFESIITKKGNNGVNTWESKTYLKIKLNSGDILLFEEGRGYFLPTIPMTTITDGIEDLTALKDFDKEE